MEEEVHGFPLLIGYLGILLILIGGITLLPLGTLLFYPEDAGEASYFIIPGIASILLGYLLSFTIRGKRKGKLERNQDALIVVCCWMLAILITAIPFMLSGKYNLTQAVFETTSGWSTTGLSVVDVEQTSHLFLMHRSSILFFGGVGLLLVMLSVLSDSFGMRLYHAEGHNDRLLPNLLRSARIILTIYLCYTLSGILLYVLCGMSVFDAIIHAIGALSTGGFSSHAESIAYYDSPAIELITMVLMLLGNINFLAHLFLLRGHLRRFFRYCEVRLSLILIALVTPLVAFLFLQSLTDSLTESLRIALFQVVSALTTTGFQTIPDLHALPHSILFVMILLQLIGGGMGSTAGGIKQYRICLLGKGVLWQIQEQLSSRNMIHAHKIHRIEHEETVNDKELVQTLCYVFLYLCLFMCGTFILVAYGNPISTSMFEFSSALGTVGLSAGIMTYDAPSLILWTGTIGMFLGRLEIIVVFLALHRFGHELTIGISHRKKHRKLL